MNTVLEVSCCLQQKDPLSLFLLVSVLLHSGMKEDVHVVCFYKRKWLGFFRLSHKGICQKMFSKFPLNHLTSNIFVFILFIFQVIHALEDILYRKTSVWLVIIFHVEHFLHVLPAPLSYSCSYILSTPPHFFVFFFHHPQHTGSFITSKGNLCTCTCFNWVPWAGMRLNT